MPTMPKDQARVLRALYEWQFTGRGEGPSRSRLEHVPDYVIAAELDGSGVDVRACLAALAGRGLVRSVGPGDAGGTWALPDGRVLRVTLRERGDGPARLYLTEVYVQDPGKPRRPVAELAGGEPCGILVELTPAGFEAAECGHTGPSEGESDKSTDDLEDAIFHAVADMAGREFIDVLLWRITVSLPPPPKDVQARRRLRNTPLTAQERIEHERRAPALDEQPTRRVSPDERRKFVTGFLADPGAAEGEVTIKVRVTGECVELEEPDPPIETLNRRAWDRIQERCGRPISLRLDQGRPVVTFADGVPIPGQRAERYGRRPAVSPTDLIDRLSRCTYTPRLTDDELDRLRVHLEQPVSPSRLQADPEERERRCALREILKYNDELRRTSAPVTVAGRAALAEAALAGPERPREPSARVTVDEARQRAEDYIKHHDFPGVNALATHPCKCSAATVRKAIAQSEKLQQAQAAHKLRKAKPGARPQTANDASWAAQVDEALRQLMEYAPASERAKLNAPDMRDQLARMAPDALAKLVDDAREHAERRKCAANRAPAGRARARTGHE